MKKFTKLSVAKGYVNRAEKIMMIVLGDDNKYWVVKPSVGENLVKQGYEYAG